MLRLATAAAAGFSAVALWSAAPAGAADWLAGDLHIHSCYSHDAYCPDTDDPITYEPGDDPSNLQEKGVEHLEKNGESIYTYGVHVDQRFTEAAARGLNFLAITDHDDIRSVSDPGFGSSGLIGLPGYENSIQGHAQVLGGMKLYDGGDEKPAAIQKLIAELHADGGVFQANHPGYRWEEPFSSCGNTSALHWKYKFDVQPDTIEVWNPTSAISAAETYLECWLARGARMGITGGSDGHWQTTTAVGVGHPTTWVLAGDRSRAGILTALREGRTAISDKPPAYGGGPLLLEGDADRDGVFEASVGDTVPPGAPMRVRSLDAGGAGRVRVRGNGQTLLDEPLAAGGEAHFTAPAAPGWVRAILRADDGSSETAPGCEPPADFISDCAYDRAMIGMTSPVYVAEPAAVTGSGGSAGTSQGTGASGQGGAAPGSPGSPTGQRRVAPRLRIYFKRQRMSTKALLRRRYAWVRVRCSLPCRAVLGLYARRRRVGRGRAILRGRGVRRVRVRLNRRALRRVSARAGFSVRIQAWTLGRY